MIKILVTGAGGGVGQGIIKALRMIEDLDIRIISADMSNLASGVYSGDVSRLIPAVSSPDYLKKLGELFEQESVQYYFPGTDVELLFCAKNKKLIEQEFGVHTVVSPLQAIAIADDKYKTAEFLKMHGFYYPETQMADLANIEELSFPIMVKPAVGCRSIGVGIARTKQELVNRVENETGLVVQELIGTEYDEYTCTVVVINGVASGVVILQRDLRAGDTFRAKPVKNGKISEYIKQVALALGVHGSCNFQLRLDSSGIPKIFEINCRFSGTTPFCAQLGFNPVEYYLKKTQGLDYQYQINYDAFVLRYWSEVIVSQGDMALLEQHSRLEVDPLKGASLFRC